MSAVPESLPAGPGNASDTQGERRASARFTLLIQTAKLISTEGEFLCIVRDSSGEGIKVRHFGHLPKDRFLAFELANGEGFTVELVWQDEEYAGLKFPEEVDIARILKDHSGAFSKRPMRLQAELEGEVNFAGFSCDVTIRNISQQGACISCDHILAIDQLLRIKANGLDQAFAKVRWRKSNIYGLVFEETLDHARLAALAAHAKDAQ